MSNRAPIVKGLRVGNYVCPISRHTEVHIPMTLCVLKVWSISHEEIETFPVGMEPSATHYWRKTDPHDVAGIELNNEWLSKFGFELFPWGWVKRSSKHFGVRLTIKGYRYQVDGNNPVNIGFVHKLQNLYYSLTGEELEVTAA